jgi:hypothetical protein
MAENHHRGTGPVIGRGCLLAVLLALALWAALIGLALVAISDLHRFL